MIDPPQDIKVTIEKTVQYVKKNGEAFEEKLLASDSEKKFSFLSNLDPYHEYYKALLEGKEVTESEGKPSKINKEVEIISQPDAFLFQTELPPVSNYDLDVIKLTAQYIACNSTKHIDQIQRYMNKRGKRSQFAFLSPKHSLHLLFRDYCKQYLTIIEIDKVKREGQEQSDKTDEVFQYVDKLINSSPQNLFERAYRRAAHDKRHKLERKLQESEDRKQQVQYALIDWQDFTFVAKINFNAVDEVTELAVPLLREDVMYRSLLAKSKEIQLETAGPREETKGSEENEGVANDLETKVEAQGTKNTGIEVKSGTGSGSVPKGMKIRAAGESRLKRKQKATERTIECPITGEQVPEQEFDHHLKVLLRDPKYKEQQDNFVRKNFTYESNLTTDQVYENIKRLVRKRGLSEEEEQETKRLDIGP